MILENQSVGTETWTCCVGAWNEYGLNNILPSIIIRNACTRHRVITSGLRCSMKSTVRWWCSYIFYAGLRIILNIFVNLECVSVVSRTSHSRISVCYYDITGSEKYGNLRCLLPGTNPRLYPSWAAMRLLGAGNKLNSCISSLANWLSIKDRILLFSLSTPRGCVFESRFCFSPSYTFIQFKVQNDGNVTHGKIA